MPDGRYRVRVTLRREGRSVIVPRTTLVDTQAPRPRVKRITPSSIVGPEAVPVQIEVGSISRRLTKRGRVYRTDDGEPRLVAELGPVEDSRTLVWDGRVDGAPAPPGTYLVKVIARDRAWNVGSEPRRIPPVRGSSRGEPGHHHPRARGRAAGAARHVGPEGARSTSTPAGARTAGGCAAWAPPSRWRAAARPRASRSS